MNHFILVGKVDMIFETECENFIKNIVVIAVKRYLKNSNGNYDIDMIDVTIPCDIVKNIIGKCEIGDTICAKGEIRRLNINTGMELVAQEISFIPKNNKINKNT